jgi:plastocyanin
MKNLIMALIAIVAIGGGIYYFTKERVVAPENGLGNSEQNMPMMDSENTGEMMQSNKDGEMMGEKMMENKEEMMGSGMMKTVKSFTISGSNFAFDKKTIEVSKGDTVKITFKNSSGKHDWKIDEFNASTKILGSGEEETVEFVADKAGSFEYYCSVGSHRQMGMVGTLTVK